MAYRRRHGKRRNYHRRRYAFTRFNTYRKRSAKAQAYQIYRLNKKINTIERKTKPEIKTLFSTYNFNVGDYCNYTFGSLTRGQGLDFDGRLLRMQNINAWFVLYKDPGLVGINSDVINFTATCRVVVYQLREATSTILSTPDQVFNLTQEERELANNLARKNAWMKAIYGPLKEGISARIKILRDFRISLSPTRHRSARLIKLYNKQIGNIERSSAANYYNRGTIYWVAITSLNTYSIASEALKLQTNIKMAYVDES